MRRQQILDIVGSEAGLQIQRAPTTRILGNRWIAYTKVQFSMIRNGEQVPFECSFSSKPETTAAATEEDVAYQILKGFFSEQTIAALERMYNYATDREQASLRNHRNAVQAITVCMQQEGQIQILQQRLTGIARSNTKLISSLRSSLHRTGHVPALHIDNPDDPEPKEGQQDTLVLQHQEQQVRGCLAT